MPDRLLDTVLAIVERYPLARRLLAGLEPDVTERVLETESFAVLRRAVAELLAEGQEAGSVRPDLPPEQPRRRHRRRRHGLGPDRADHPRRLRAGPGQATVLRGLLTPDPRWG